MGGPTPAPTTLVNLTADFEQDRDEMTMLMTGRARVYVDAPARSMYVVPLRTCTALAGTAPRGVP